MWGMGRRGVGHGGGWCEAWGSGCGAWSVRRWLGALGVGHELWGLRCGTWGMGRRGVGHGDLGWGIGHEVCGALRRAWGLGRGA